MYKVFINDKPLFFLQNLEEITVATGSGVIEFDEEIDLEDLFDFHEHNMVTIVLGNEQDWNHFCAMFCLVKAAGGLVQRGADFLFIYRHNKWDLPKGKIELGETEQDAAIREVEEECGIRPALLHHLIDTFHTYFEAGKWILKRTYWYAMEYKGIEELAPQIEEGITKVEWIPAKQWNVVLENTYGSIQDVLDRSS